MTECAYGDGETCHCYDPSECTEPLIAHLNLYVINAAVALAFKAAVLPPTVQVES